MKTDAVHEISCYTIMYSTEDVFMLTSLAMLNFSIQKTNLDKNSVR